MSKTFVRVVCIAMAAMMVLGVVATLFSIIGYA
jgi:hypothetical protein